MGRPRSVFRLLDYTVDEGPGREQLSLICQAHGAIARFELVAEIPLPLAELMAAARAHHDTVHRSVTAAARSGRYQPGGC